MALTPDLTENDLGDVAISSGQLKLAVDSFTLSGGSSGSGSSTSSGTGSVGLTGSAHSTSSGTGSYIVQGSGSAVGTAVNSAIAYIIPANQGVINHIYYRDSSLNIVGQIDVFEYVTVVPRFDDVGYWEIQLPASSPAAQFWMNNWIAGKPIGGIVVTKQDNTTLLSGPVWQIQDVQQQTDSELLTFSGPDDMVELGWIMCMPHAPALDTTTQIYDQQYGSGETLMKHYVSVNAGPSANSVRQTIATIEADSGRGVNVLSLGRFQSLLTMCRDLAVKSGAGYGTTPAAGAGGGVAINFALTGGPQINSSISAVARGSAVNSCAPGYTSSAGSVGSGTESGTYVARGSAVNSCTPGYNLVGPGVLGFKVVQAGLGLEFLVYSTNDFSQSVRLQTGGQGIREFNVQIVGPNLTSTLVGGAGSGTSRPFVWVNDTNAQTQWGRVEGFTDDSADTDATAMGQAGQSALVQQQRTLNVQVVVRDTVAIQFGKNYNVGDKIAALIRTVVYADVVQEVTITKSNQDSEVVTPVIGSFGQSQSPQLFQDQSRSIQDLQRLQ